MAEPSASTATTRRGFLDWLIGIGVVGWLGSVLYPVLRYLKPLSAQGSSGPVQLTPEEMAKVEKDKFTIVRSADARIIVFEAAGTLKALSAKCTHEGCTVQYSPGESVIWCACHNGHFDLDGRVVSGPPPRPLPKYVVSRDQSGNVVVTPEKA